MKTALWLILMALSMLWGYFVGLHINLSENHTRTQTPTTSVTEPLEVVDNHGMQASPNTVQTTTTLEALQPARSK